MGSNKEQIKRVQTKSSSNGFRQIAKQKGSDKEPNKKVQTKNKLNAFKQE